MIMSIENIKKEMAIEKQDILYHCANLVNRSSKILAWYDRQLIPLTSDEKLMEKDMIESYTTFENRKG